MTSRTSDSSWLFQKQPGIVARVLRAAARPLAGIPALLVPALEWLPSIPEGWRTTLILVSLALAALGFNIIKREERTLKLVEEEKREILASIERADPEYLMRQIAEPLFSDGAWRLSVYEKSRAADGPTRLIKLASVASDKEISQACAAEIPVNRGSMFAAYFENNLANPRYRHAQESGNGPEGSHTIEGAYEWVNWHKAIFFPPDGEDVKLEIPAYRPRKLVWYAAQDSESGGTIYVSIAESTNPGGINIDVLDQRLTAAWLFSIPRFAQLHGHKSIGGTLNGGLVRPAR